MAKVGAAGEPLSYCCNNCAALAEQLNDSTELEKPKCANCGKRPGTIRWGDALAITHGFSTWWCEVCALKAQITHAEERSAALPDLYERLAKAYESSDECECRGECPCKEE